MYKEGYSLHNPAIPYYASDYRSAASLAFIFQDNYDLSVSPNHGISGCFLLAISDQIGASIHDRVHFRPAVFIDGARTRLLSLLPTYFPYHVEINSSGTNEESDPVSDDGTVTFNPPLGPTSSSYLCHQYTYRIDLIGIRFDA